MISSLTKTRALAVCLLLMQSTYAAAQDTVPLEFTPAGQWSLDYGEDACTLTRRFSSESGEIALFIEQVMPGHFLSVTLASEQLQGGRGSVEIVVFPGAELRTLENPIRGRSGELTAVRFSDTLLPTIPQNASLADAAALARYAQAENATTHVQVTNAFSQPISLRLGSTANVMGLVRSCVDDLLVTWGMDPTVAAQVAVPPVRVGQLDWAQRVQHAYPRDMVRQGRSALVRVVLQTAADGSVSHCHAHNPQPYPQFEETTCRVLLEHARYEPARDMAGNAVPGLDTMDVVFSLGS